MQGKIWVVRHSWCFNDKEKSYVGTAGNDYIGGVVIASSLEEVKELLESAIGYAIDKYSYDRWLIYEIGTADYPAKRVELLAYGQY